MGWLGPHVSKPGSSVSPPYQGQDQVPIMPTALEFLENHGKNILLSNGNRTATRVASYNQGIVVISQALVPQLLVQVSRASLSLAPLAKVTQGQPSWTKAFPGLGQRACRLLFILYGGSCWLVISKHPPGDCSKRSSRVGWG